MTKGFELALGIQTCESCFTNYDVLRNFNIVDVREHYNHTLLNSVWSKLSLTKLRYYRLELLI